MKTPHRTPQLTSADGRRSFQVARQIEVYRTGRRTDSDAIPKSVDALRERARLRLSEEVFDWIGGGAGGEQTMRANRLAFDRWQIVPRMLCDVAERDLSIELFGRRYAHPFMVAPIGVQALLHPDGEKATAAAAASLGVPFVLSTVSSHTIEDVAEAADRGAASNHEAPRWFQLYWSKETELTRSLIHRAERAGYQALVVTLDTQTLGWRERNLDLGYLPFLHGEGIANYLSDPVFRLLLENEDASGGTDAAVELYLRVFSSLSHTWNDLQQVRESTRLPILLKGIQHADDARRAVDCGMDGVIVSNHGGRQVDGAIAALDALSAIVAAVGNETTIMMDSGIRRGADAFKALALGARAVLLGRPVMWSLAVGGVNGVREFLLNFAADLDLTFALSGKRSCDELNPECLDSTSSQEDRTL